MKKTRKHWVVVGGGIIGTVVAFELSKRGEGSVLVLEKENALGRHQSGRNSGVIHSGINQNPGSLKAKMCVEGSWKLREYCKKRRVPMTECGTLVIARNNRELETLDTLLRMGIACGVPSLRLIGQGELREREPTAKGHTALFSPSGAVVDSAALLQSLAEDAKKAGVQHRMAHQVFAIADNTVHTNLGDIQFDYLINCAGLYADKVARMMGLASEYRIIPFRGEYMEVTGCAVRSMIYQPPDLRFPFLSIHLTRETDGRVLAGPSAVLAFGREAYNKEWVVRDMADMFFSRQFVKMMVRPQFLRLAAENMKTSFSKMTFLKQVQSIVSGIGPGQIKPYQSGIRAQVVDSNGELVDDILIERHHRSTHILNAVSPGMTCSLAFAEHVVDQILN